MHVVYANYPAHAGENCAISVHIKPLASINWCTGMLYSSHLLHICDCRYDYCDSNENQMNSGKATIPT